MKFKGFIANVIKKPGSCATTQKMTQRQVYRLRKDFNHTSGISWVLDDESYFTLSHSTINGNDIFYSSNSAKTLASVKYTPVKKFEPKLLVWVCVSKKGISATIFRQSGMAVNKTVYKGFIKDGVLPFINQHHSDSNYKFWPDLASSHYATEVVEYYRAQKIKFVEKCENSANVPEVRAIEDFW